MVAWESSGREAMYTLYIRRCASCLGCCKTVRQAIQRDTKVISVRTNKITCSITPPELSQLARGSSNPSREPAPTPSHLSDAERSKTNSEQIPATSDVRPSNSAFEAVLNSCEPATGGCEGIFPNGVCNWRRLDASLCAAETVGSR